MEFRFTKMHGLGNDFIVADDRDVIWDLEPDAVAWLCDRHFGVGADGLMLVRPASVPDADHLMLFHNADGSPAEMCGNGIRCFAKFLADRDLVTGDRVRVQTIGGVRTVELIRDDGGSVVSARVDMGEPVLEPSLIPVDLPGAQVFECPLDTPEGTVRITAVSMGNPHAVIWVDDVDEAPVGIIGPLVESHPVFPKKTNVEFAQLSDEPNTIRLRVWERGVGETLACGTGACAAAVTSVLSCRTDRTVAVELPGGELEVTWSEAGPVLLAGPAEEVFAGSVTIPDAG